MIPYRPGPVTALLAALYLCIGFLESAEAAPKAAELVRADLVSEVGAVRPGEPFTVGVKLTAKEHWHTYWRNPGDSGLATTIAWTLPAGFAAGEIQWPIPERIPVGPLVNYGFEGETVLLVRITPPRDLSAGQPIVIKAAVNYLVCEKICIPGEASLSTDLPVTGPGGATGIGPGRSVIEAARARLPQPSPWSSRVVLDGGAVTLALDAPGLKQEAIRSAYFFPYDETAIEHAAEQPVSVDGAGLSLKLTRSSLATAPPPADLGGVLVIEEVLDGVTSRQALAIGREPAFAAGGGAQPAPAESSIATILQATVLAFLGGLILNLMPCVFPVLSIKVLSLVRHSGHSAGAVRLHGLAYTLGVVATFVALAGVLVALRAAGAEIGWGFQLQSPVVVAGLAFLLFAMGLSLSGVVEFGTSFAGVGGRFASGDGYGGSFGTGVLATVVATPCTAPFMGSAIGYALTAPAGVALAVFVALGLGMAAPFLALTCAPRLLALLPRPGGWMEVLKQILAFPLYATVAWLVFVLAQQVGPTGLFAALLGMVVVAFGLWAWRFAGTAGPGGRRIAFGAALASLAALVGLGTIIARDAGVAPGPASVAEASSGVEPFTQARLDTLASEGRPAFVNFTAAWCITCLVNERTTLSSAAVREAFAARGVAYLKGDWTNQNAEITRILARHGRSGVPLYLVVPPSGEAIVLPQILTEAIVLESLDRVTPAPTKRADLVSQSQPSTGASR